MNASPPLQKRRIVVTRSPEQAGAMCAQLAALGATCIRFPAIDFTPLPAPELDAALAQPGRYAWLIFTSGNAVRFFLERVAGSQWQAVRDRPRIAAVGSATQKRLAANGIPVDFVPDEFTGEQLAWGLGEVAGRRILLPRARIGRPEIVDLLRQRGALVDDIPLYDTVTAVPTPAALAELQKGVDVLTFTSPSSVRNFLQILEVAGQPRPPALVACIGPSTAAEAEQSGLSVEIVPESYTIEDLVTAVAAYFETNPA